MTEDIGRSVPDDWKSVVGYEGVYSVSSAGEVYSHRSARLLKPYLIKGYPTVSLKVGGGRKFGRVHRMVAEAFLGPAPDEAPECAHLDGVPTNNHLSNLQWVSRKENESHKRLHDDRPYPAKLTVEQVQIIRLARDRKLTRRELAILSSVSERAIDGILAGETYRGI